MKLKKQDAITKLAKVYVVTEEVILSAFSNLCPSGALNLEPNHENINKYAAKVKEEPMYYSGKIDLSDEEQKQKLRKLLPKITKGLNISRDLAIFAFLNNIPFEEFDKWLTEISEEHRKEELDFKRKFSELLKRDKFKALIITN